MQDSISRRGFLTRGGQLLAALAPGATMLGAPAWAGKPDGDVGKKPYFVLQPEWNTKESHCNVTERAKLSDCHGCNACHKHAKNKIFASRRAADRNRAHPHCKCRVIRGGKLDEKSWAEMFGGLKNPSRTVVDRRKQRTKTVLRRARRRAG